MNISEFVKKSVAFGMGTVAFSAEKMKQFADEMVARGEMSSDEASNFVNDMTQRADEEKTVFQNWVRDQMAKMLMQAGVAEAEKLNRLERRVVELEKKLGIVTAETEAEKEPESTSDTNGEQDSPVGAQ